MTTAQVRCFDDLLCVGGARPTMPAGLVEELGATIESGTAAAVERWTENRLFVTKAQIGTALRCEGQLVADASTARGPINAASAVGTLAHRAIQISHTHRGHPVADYVKWALSGARSEDDFSLMWDEADPGLQSDLLVRASSMVTAYLDCWPPLDDVWTPRFEEPIQARIGRLTLSSRADLVLGRPRTDGRQTMFLCDFKTGALKDEHDDEAAFYALVATLRHGVAPFRSTVYSLASGDWSPPDVTPAVLRGAAKRVVEGVNAIVDVLTERREAALAAGPHCRWCPKKDSCSTHAAFLAEGPSTPGAVRTVEVRPSEPRASSTEVAAAVDHRSVLETVGAPSEPEPDPFELD